MTAAMAVEILTGSRMHFGLICGTAQTGWKFGGFGLMVRTPGWKIQLRTLATPSTIDRTFMDTGTGSEVKHTVDPDRSDDRPSRVEWASDGSKSKSSAEINPAANDVDVVRAVLHRAQLGWDAVTTRLEWNAEQRERLNRTQVRIVQAPPLHSGFGAGTQLTLALGCGAEVLCGPDRTTSMFQLAQRLGRAERSAVGTEGFARGGLVVDFGESSAVSDSRKLQRIHVPDAWRFVLVRPLHTAGLSGDQERDFFARQQTMDTSTVQQLSQLVLDQVLPAVQCGDFTGFAAAVEMYGRIAGQFYASTQGDVFAHPQMNALANWLFGRHVHGVAQSSWGPGICIPAESEAHATDISRLVRQFVAGTPTDVTMTSAMNEGTLIRSAAPEMAATRFA